MQAFDLPLMSHTKPVIERYGYTALVDTGAGIPIFYLPKDIVEKEFDGHRIGSGTVSGATSNPIDGPIYRIKGFRIGEYHLCDIPVQVCDDESALNEVEYDILLGSCLFGESVLTIDYAERRIRCEMPEMVFNAGKLWQYASGGWHMIDYDEKNGRWVRI